MTDASSVVRSLLERLDKSRDSEEAMQLSIALKNIVEAYVMLHQSPPVGADMDELE